jgi:hypothetical protein
MEDLAFERIDARNNLTGLAWYKAKVPGGHVLACHNSGNGRTSLCHVPDVPEIKGWGDVYEAAAREGYEEKRERIKSWAKEHDPLQTPTATYAPPQVKEADRSIAVASAAYVDRATTPLQRKDAFGRWRKLQDVHKPKIGDVVRGDGIAESTITKIGPSGVLQLEPAS